MSHLSTINDNNMEASNGLAESIKRDYKNRGEEISDFEAKEAGQNLVGFFELLLEISMKEDEKKRRLKKEPDGFPVDGTYNCLVCYAMINETTGWYDWYGQTCLPCHKAIKDGVIPTFVCTGRNSFYTSSSLRYTFNIAHQTAKKMVREGKLKARIVLNESGKPYQYIFLKKENPSLIDPERDTQWLKSCKRHSDKVLDARIKIENKKAAEEIKKMKAKYKKHI